MHRAFEVLQVIVGLVAIGRNEGERLRACLESARQDCSAVVYVDSGSTDKSVELAKSLGVHVVDLDLGIPFTAARARNEGFAALKNILPNMEAVQFVDGDCELVKDWIAKASEQLASNPKAAVICGRRRERYPNNSIYNKLADMEWDTPIGIAKACGGDALIRAIAFEQVGGYNPSVIAGEEPEMCVRLRAAGWTIHRIDAEMTLHDAAMTRFGQWWKRNVRAGYAYAQGFALHGNPPELFRQKEVASIKKWATVPLLATIVLTVGIVFVMPRWCWLGVVPLLLYPVLACKVAAARVKRGNQPLDAASYGMSVVIGKFPQWMGVRRFEAAQRRGERVGIIEYKGAGN